MSPRREIVEAGAGCGKTTGLVERYLYGMGYERDPKNAKLLRPLGNRARISP